MYRPDIITLAGASGTNGDYGTIPTIPAGCILFVRCPAGRHVQKIDWSISCNKAHSYQFYRAESAIQTLGTLALSGWLNTETIFVMGNIYTAATSTTTWSTRGISIAGTDAVDGTLLAKAITGGALVTLASVAAADTVTVNGTVFTAHATTTTAANREFSIAGTNAQDAAELVTCVNDATYGASGVTATQGAATGEVLLGWTTVTGAAAPTVTSSNATRLAVSSVGETYVYATDAATANGTITLRYRPAYVDYAAGHLPFVYSAKTGTATSHCVVTHSGLTGMHTDGAAVTSLTDNSTTAGNLYTQTINGWPQAYLAVTNNDGSNAATMVIKATRVPWAY